MLLHQITALEGQLRSAKPSDPDFGRGHLI
jgi:hypothetical protein